MNSAVAEESRHFDVNNIICKLHSVDREFAGHNSFFFSKWDINTSRKWVEL